WQFEGDAELVLVDFREEREFQPAGRPAAGDQHHHRQSHHQRAAAQAPAQDPAVEPAKGARGLSPLGQQLQPRAQPLRAGRRASAGRGLTCCWLSSRGESIGPKVHAATSEIAMALATVMPKALKTIPAMPPVNVTGKNTEIIVSAMASTESATWAVSRLAAAI